MKRVSVLVCLVVLAISTPAVAQDTPRVDISGGYQGMLDVGNEQFYTKGWYFDVAGNLTSFLGIVFQAGGNSESFSETESSTDPGFPPFIPPTTFTSSSTENFDINQYMGGVRLNARGERVTPFGHFLVGIVKSSSEGSFSYTATPPIPGFPDISESFSESSSDFAIQLGGGVDIRIAGGFGIRAGADYLRVFPEADEFGETQGGNVFRYVVGGVYSF